MNSEEFINFLKTVDKLPREYYSIIREGILQINDDKKKLLEVIVELKDKINKAIEYIDKLEDMKKEIERLNNIIDNARKYIENNQSGCENENGHFHLNFDGDIWELYEMLRRF